MKPAAVRVPPQGEHGPGDADGEGGRPAGEDAVDGLRRRAARACPRGRATLHSGAGRGEQHAFAQQLGDGGDGVGIAPGRAAVRPGRRWAGGHGPGSVPSTCSHARAICPYSDADHQNGRMTSVTAVRRVLDDALTRIARYIVLARRRDMLRRLPGLSRRSAPCPSGPSPSRRKLTFDEPVTALRVRIVNGTVNVVGTDEGSGPPGGVRGRRPAADVVTQEGGTLTVAYEDLPWKGFLKWLDRKGWRRRKLARASSLAVPPARVSRWAWSAPRPSSPASAGRHRGERGLRRHHPGRALRPGPRATPSSGNVEAQSVTGDLRLPLRLRRPDRRRRRGRDRAGRLGQRRHAHRPRPGTARARPTSR